MSLLCSCTSDDVVIPPQIPGGDNPFNPLLIDIVDGNNGEKIAKNRLYAKEIKAYTSDLRSKKFSSLEELTNYVDNQIENIYEEARKRGEYTPKVTKEGEEYIQSLDYLDYTECNTIEDIQNLMISQLDNSDVPLNGDEYVAFMVAVETMDEAIELISEFEPSMSKEQIVKSAKEFLKCFLGTRGSALVGAAAGIVAGNVPGAVIGAFGGYLVGIATFCL